MARNTLYPYGTGGEVPAGIPIINDITTGGADKALSAEMGKYLGELIDELPRFPLEFGDVDEDGIFLVDESLNIGVVIDSDGLTAINSVELEEL